MSAQTDPHSAPFDPTWTLGDRIRKARRWARLTTKELAAELTKRGYPSSAARVGAWENLNRHPRGFYETLKVIAEVCNVPYDWLVSGGSPTSFVDLRLVELPPGQMVLFHDDVTPATLAAV